MNEYVEAKKRIFGFQDNDSLLVLNADDGYSSVFAESAKGRVRMISGKNETSDVYFNEQGIFDRSGNLLVRDEDIRIVGRHNISSYFCFHTNYKG